jgi:putative FmdB family regulatory protein
MPLYDYRCEDCGAELTAYRPVAQYREPLPCACGGLAARRIVAPAVVADYAGYESPVTGRWIEGRRAHQEELARTGCRVYERGETQEFIRRKAERQRQFDRAVEEVVEQAAAQIS